jgi:hypothetical protein
MVHVTTLLYTSRSDGPSQIRSVHERLLLLAILLDDCTSIFGGSRAQITWIGHLTYISHRSGPRSELVKDQQAGDKHGSRDWLAAEWIPPAESLLELCL